MKTHCFAGFPILCSRKSCKAKQKKFCFLASGCIYGRKGWYDSFVSPLTLSPRKILNQNSWRDGKGLLICGCFGFQSSESPAFILRGFSPASASGGNKNVWFWNPKEHKFQRVKRTRHWFCFRFLTHAAAKGKRKYALKAPATVMLPSS